MSLPKKRQYRGITTLASYRILNKVGQGTFGEVYRARRLTEEVALKRIIMTNETNGFPITALREIKILKQLRHDNIVSLLEMIVERGDKQKKRRADIYMVFPFMQHDLTGLMAHYQLNLGQIKTYFKQLLEGLGYLHSMNIIHRDLKCSNLLIGNDGTLKIGDFGLARHVEEGRPMTNCVVTRWYRPPELLMGAKLYDYGVDMWGAGCILAEMILRKPLLPGESELDQLQRIFALCGSPLEESMPGFTTYCSEVTWKPSERTLVERLKGIDETALGLLDNLLVLDSKKRPSAKEVVDHDFIWNQPMPAKKEEMPKLEFDAHESSVKKQKK